MERVKAIHTLLGHVSDACEHVWTDARLDHEAAARCTIGEGPTSTRSQCATNRLILAIGNHTRMGPKPVHAAIDWWKGGGNGAGRFRSSTLRYRRPRLFRG